jgi:hypothetical protein
MSRTQAARGSRHGKVGLRRPSACGRARLSAFHLGSHLGSHRPKAQLRPCFLGLGLNGCYPPSPVPVQGSTSRPGHSAGRLMPEPPGSGVDETPPAGTALAPAARHHRTASLRARFDSLESNRNGDYCQWKCDDRHSGASRSDEPGMTTGALFMIGEARRSALATSSGRAGYIQLYPISRRGVSAPSIMFRPRVPIRHSKGCFTWNSASAFRLTTTAPPRSSSRPACAVAAPAASASAATASSAKPAPEPDGSPS